MIILKTLASDVQEGPENQVDYQNQTTQTHLMIIKGLPLTLTVDFVNSPLLMSLDFHVEYIGRFS